MDQQQLFQKIESFSVIPVIAIESPELVMPLTDALIAGGLPVAEITFRTKAAAEVIKNLKKERPGILIGAGTILSVDDLLKAKESGAEFGVSPGFNEEIVKKALEIGLPFFPGVMTPTDIERGLSLGIKVLKFFPAEECGGTSMLKSLSAPYAHLGVRFIPTGGINIRNLPDYLALNQVIAVGGTWIAKKEAIASKNWDEIRENVRAARDVVLRIRGNK